MLKSLAMKKIGRNDTCHCGSGKKFKKCCENRLLSQKKVSRVFSLGSTQSPLSSLFKEAFLPKPIDPLIESYTNYQK